tara:strand:+ start:410 stop:1096 length:687 start_codon:yes stop_codon:yes gene_type:complete
LKFQSSDILFEDNHLIIVNKQCGVLVQGDNTGDTPLLELVKEYIKNKYDKTGNVFLGLVNRIDRPVSGIVIFARTSKALSRMNDKLKKRQIRKLYWLFISNKFKSKEGKIEGWFKKNKKINKSFFSEEEINNSKHGSLNYKIIEKLKKYLKIEVDLKTGRHHQIRCSFSEIGFPILGDIKYGSKRSNKGGGIYLHSREVNFIHPVSKEEVIIKAEPPISGLWSASPFD